MRASTTTTLLATTAALASAQRGSWGNGNDDNGNYGSLAGFSCLSSCASSIDSSCSAGDLSCYCENNISDLNSCIESSDCSDSDKSDTYQAIAQVCANAGATVTASPEASFSATSGEHDSWESKSWDGSGRGGWGDGSGQAWGANGASVPASASAAFASWTSAQSGIVPTSVSAAWASWASAHSGQASEWPTAASAWTSWASEQGLPTGAPFWGGSAYPTASWASQLSDWATMTKSGDGYGPGSYNSGSGWNPGNGYGPFGHGGSQNGWGPWASQSDGAWTAGPWTNWWGGAANDCPGSTWSGWTNGPWSTAAPWTTWSGCAASTTATSTVVSTVTNSAGSTSLSSSLSFGIQVAAATDASASSSQSDSAAVGIKGQSVQAGTTALVGAVMAVAVAVGAVAL